MVKILIIKGQGADRANLQDLLSTAGYPVICAEDGPTGVRAARENLPGLILCDGRLCGLDGDGIWPAWLADPLTATIPFICLADRDAPADFRRGMDLGFDDVLARPFTRDRLLRVVETRLGKQKRIIAGSQKQMNDLRDSITHSLPPELLTPLSVILGYSELLSADGREGNQNTNREMAVEIHQAAQRLLRTTQNFLLLTELELIRSDLVALAGSRSSRVESARDAIMEIVWAKGLKDGCAERVTANVEDASLAITESHLQKIVEELLENACRYSPPETPILVEGRRDPAAHCYRLSIGDNGRGMTAEQVAGIGMFMQFDRKKYVQPGSGLGLALVRKVIEIHQGDWEISSIPGRGTTVRLRIPLAGETV